MFERNLQIFQTARILPARSGISVKKESDIITALSVFIAVKFEQ